MWGRDPQQSEKIFYFQFTITQSLMKESFWKFSTLYIHLQGRNRDIASRGNTRGGRYHSVPPESCTVFFFIPGPKVRNHVWIKQLRKIIIGNLFLIYLSSFCGVKLPPEFFFLLAPGSAEAHTAITATRLKNKTFDWQLNMRSRRMTQFVLFVLRVETPESSTWNLQYF